MVYASLILYGQRVVQLVCFRRNAITQYKILIEAATEGVL